MTADEQRGGSMLERVGVEAVEAVAAAIWSSLYEEGLAREGTIERALAMQAATQVLTALRGLTLVYRQDGQVVHELRGAPDDIWKTLLDAALSTPSQPGQHDAPGMGEGL